MFRSKWIERKENLKEGAIVLLMDPRPRNQWNLGRITKVFPGQDGVVRSVEVRTKTGQLVRPVTKLCPLEGGNGNEKSVS